MILGKKSNYLHLMDDVSSLDSCRITNSDQETRKDVVNNTSSPFTSVKLDGFKYIMQLD